MSIWKPIDTAPNKHLNEVRYILIGDRICVPDLVTWHPRRPERITPGGTHYMAVPEGWFTPCGMRSRLDGKATVWTPLPEYD